MKRLLQITTVIYLLFASCTKDVGLFPENTSHLQLADSIIYTDIADTCFTSVGYYYMHPSGCGMVPAPGDSTANRIFDLDSDQITDMEVTLHHFTFTISVSNPCSNYGYNNLCLAQLNPAFSFAVKSASAVTTNSLYSAGDVIDSSCNWQSNAYPRYSWSFAGYGFTDNHYAAIRIVENGNTYYGWILLSNMGSIGGCIKSWAINYTSNNPILAGQNI